MKPITPGDAAMVLDQAPSGLTFFYGPAGSGRSSYLTAYAEWLVFKVPQVHVFFVEAEMQFVERLRGKALTVYIPPATTPDMLEQALNVAPPESVLLVDSVQLLSLPSTRTLASFLADLHRKAVAKNVRIIGTVQTREGSGHEQPAENDVLADVTRIPVP